MNTVTLMGRLTRDPELSYNNATGNAMTRFNLAVDRKLSREKRQEMESKNQATADFINIVCWGKLAEAVNSYTAKGKRVLVEGRIQTGRYQAQDGSTRYTTDVVANAVEFIDWKDRAGGNSGNSYESHPDQFPQNPEADRNDSSSDGFFGQDFKPVDDDRIPF